MMCQLVPLAPGSSQCLYCGGSAPKACPGYPALKAKMVARKAQYEAALSVAMAPQSAFALAA